MSDLPDRNNLEPTHKQLRLEVSRFRQVERDIVASQDRYQALLDGIQEDDF